MKKSIVKPLLLEGLLASVILLIPFLVFAIVPYGMLLYWFIALLAALIYRTKKQSQHLPKWYAMFEKYTFFQVITWSFAFFLIIPQLMTMGLTIPIVFLILAFNKKVRNHPNYIKWLKYTGFLLFNLIVMIVLLAAFPNIGPGGELFFPVSIFFNGALAAVYLKLEPIYKRVNRHRFMLAIIILMMLGSIISLYPNADDLTLLQQIFGG